MKLAEYHAPSRVNTTPRVDPPNGEARGSFLHHLWASLAATVILVVICCGIYPLLVWVIAQGVFPVQANGSLVKKDGSFTTQEGEAVGSALLGQNFSAPQYFHPRPSQNSYDAANSGGSNLGPISDKLLNGATATQPAGSASSSTQPVETLAFDGVRLRTIHYALDNGISFKLYTAKFGQDGSISSQTQVPLSKFQDKEGNLNDIALVDAFPHAGDPDDKTPLIAADFATAIPADAVTASGSGLDPHISPENATLQAPRVANARKISQERVLMLVRQYMDQPSLGILGEAGVNVLQLNIALDRMAPQPAPASAPASDAAPASAVSTK